MGGLFGGGSKSTPPPPVAVPAPPPVEETAEEQRRKANAARALKSKTILSSPLGDQSEAEVSKKTLLGG